MVLMEIWSFIISYETPRLVKIHNKKLGLMRRFIQLSVILYVSVYAIWFEKGYQEFSRGESSVTVKIKGVTKSKLLNGSSYDVGLYTRVWDEADYVVPPAENGAFFVATNAIITPNQTRGRCPDDPRAKEKLVCQPNNTTCEIDHEDKGQWRHKMNVTPLEVKTYGENGTLKCKSESCPTDSLSSSNHGPLTGFCVLSDRPKESDEVSHVCEVEAWCPVEINHLPLGQDHGLMERADHYTIYVKNSISFSYFGPQYKRNNLKDPTSKPCLFEGDSGVVKKSRNNNMNNNGCQIFRLGDIVTRAGGNLTKMAVLGGVVSMTISWECDLDYDFMSTCFPTYNFAILDQTGWNFREASYHEENRRTLRKLYGIKVIILVKSLAGKFSVKNMVINIGSGVALLGISTIICDFLLMYIKEKGVVQKKKYNYISPVQSKQRDANFDNSGVEENGIKFENDSDGFELKIPRTKRNSVAQNLENQSSNLQKKF